MPFKHVGDIMIPLDDYPHLPHWFTLRQALAELTGARYEIAGGKMVSPIAALVFDEEYQLLGLLRLRDILRGIEPRYLAGEKLHLKYQDISTRPDPDLMDLSLEMTVKTIREQSERRVSEVMQPIVATLRFEDPLMKAASMFVEHGLNLIPVLSDGKVVGVVNTVAVCHELAQLVL